MNKDLNGGFGTADTYSRTLIEAILAFFKKKNINLPIISLAFLMGILKQRNISARFYEGKLPDIEPEVILIYGSMVDYKNENHICEVLRDKFSNAKIGFIGPFPSTKPELFKNGDFVIVGDFEYFFLKEFKDKSQLNGKVIVEEKVDLNELPLPELEGFDIKRYSYFPLITKKPFFTLQASKGCPYSCIYYCVYARFQGNKVIVRSPERVVEDIIHLKSKYGINGFQFRDPIFGVNEYFIEEFCDEIQKRNLRIQWGIETRADILDERKIRIMFDAGLRNINIGIETIEPEIAKQNKRLLVNKERQEELIRYCEAIGVKVAAFYLFGYEQDTKESMEATLRYAKRLNTFLARFAIFTPYPGTEFFDDLEARGKIATHEYEKYTQFNLVMQHQNVGEKDIQEMLSKAYKEYYFRPRYILKLLKWKIREFWL